MTSDNGRVLCRCGKYIPNRLSAAMARPVSSGMTIKKVHGKLSDVKKAVGIGELLPTARNGSAAAVGRA